MWDLVSQPGMKPRTPALAAWSLRNWNNWGSPKWWEVLKPMSSIMSFQPYILQCTSIFKKNFYINSNKANDNSPWENRQQLQILLNSVSFSGTTILVWPEISVSFLMACCFTVSFSSSVVWSFLCSISDRSFFSCCPSCPETPTIFTSYLNAKLVSNLVLFFPISLFPLQLILFLA